MLKYELKRYNELKEIINNERFNEISLFVDYNIINKTDLRELMIDKILESPKVPFVELTDYFTFLNYNENSLMNNEKRLDLLLKKAIDSGEYLSEYINHFGNRSQIYLDYLYEKIKDPFYRLVRIPTSMKNDSNFVNYCLDNKNLSVLGMISDHYDYIDKEMPDDIYRKVIKLQKEGYGFFLSEPFDYKNHNLISYDIDKYDDLFINNLKNGYVSIYISKYVENPLEDPEVRERKVIDILKNLIDKDKDIIFEKNYSSIISPYILNDVIRYVLINKKTKYIYLLRLMSEYDLSDENRKLLHELTLEDTSIYRNDCKRSFFMYDEYDLLKKFLDEGKLDILFLNIDIDFFVDNLDIIKNKIIKSKYFFKNDHIVNIILNIGDYSFISSIVDANYENLFLIMNYFNSDKYSSYTKHLYDAIKKSIASYYELNINHLDIMVEKFGYDIIEYIENSNIRNAINLDDENFNKYINLFDIKDLNLEDVKNIYDSLSQARFQIVHKSDVKRLDRIKSILSKKKVPIDDIKLLADNINIHKLRKINNKLFTEEELIKIEKNPYDYLVKLCNEIINKENVERNLTILYNINRQYIKDKREEFRDNNDYSDEVDLVLEYDEKSLRDAFARYLYYSKDSKSIYDIDFQSILDELDHMSLRICNEDDSIDNETIILMVIEFLKSNGREYNIDIVRRSVKAVKKILSHTKTVDLLMNLELDDYDIDKYKLQNVKKIYRPSKNSRTIYSILMGVNPLELRDTVFIDDDKERSLVKFLKKYKLVFWEDTFKRALKVDNIELDNYAIAKMISKYNEIFLYIEDMKRKGKDANLTDIIRYGSILSSSSSRYSILFGKENARLIKLNPPPLNSPVVGNREEYAVEDYYGLYQRKYITVPPIDKDIVVGKKKYHVNIGNFTNSINLVYGEKTGSCMRIGGIGETLYRFCQENPNGFHVRITDPDTGELITRVSGFRNGNSVFLNQLRESLNEKKYSNSDLINVIKEIASMIINNSKDSSLPIENIFISIGEAMKSCYDLSIVNVSEDIKEGLPYFYFDFHVAGLCLKTTSVSQDYAPIDTSKEKLPYYRVLREKVKATDSKEEIIITLNKYKMLKEMINSKRIDTYKSVELVSIEEASKVIYLISGEDFIAYLNDDLEIVVDYIERDDDRVKVEIDAAVRELNNKREEYLHERRNRNSH